jgi:hypothetical protein
LTNGQKRLVFRAIHKGGFIAGESITPQAIRDSAKYYGEQNGKPELLQSWHIKAARALIRSNSL